VMDACVGNTEMWLGELETTDLEANLEEIEAAMEPVGEQMDRYGDRNQATGCRLQLKVPTQDVGELRQKLNASRRRMNCSAVSVLSKGCISMGPGRNNVAK
jgi:hypothetical protein